MPPPSPPNQRLAALVAMLGEVDTRELLELFLVGLPDMLGQLGSADRSEAERAAHSLKSSAKQMGLLPFAQRMADLEQRLRSGGPAVDPAESRAIAEEVAQACQPLQAYLGPAGGP